MDCRKVKKLLTQYIENDIEKDLSLIIKKHLSSCKECSTELAYYKKYEKEIASLKAVKPPVDFLEKLNMRMEKQSYLSRLFSTLFLPLKIKLPIEALGLLATIVLIIYFFNPVEQIEKSTHFAAIPEYKNEPQEAKIAKPDKSLNAKKTIPPSTQHEEKPILARADNKSKNIQRNTAETYEIALLLKQPEPYAAVLEKSKDISRPALSMSSETRNSIIADKINENKSGAGFKNNMLDDSVKAEKTAEAENEPESKERKAKDEEDKINAIEKTVEKIRNITDSLNGKVLTVEPDKDGNIQYIVIEIPGKYQNEFLDRLSGLGEIKKQITNNAGDRYSTVKIRIQIDKE